jgi:hypothetical protein
LAVLREGAARLDVEHAAGLDEQASGALLDSDFYVLTVGLCRHGGLLLRW